MFSINTNTSAISAYNSLNLINTGKIQTSKHALDSETVSSGNRINDAASPSVMLTLSPEAMAMARQSTTTHGTNSSSVDVDYASTDYANLARSKIINNASKSMLDQSSASPSSVMSLFR